MIQCKKTEMVIIKSKQNKSESNLKIKLFGEWLYSTGSIKHLGVKSDANLSYSYYVNNLFIKLNRVNTLLFKMRKYPSFKTLKFI